MASADPDTELPEVSPDDPVQIQYTSGTTGFPKGAYLHHRGITNNARFTLERLGLYPGAIVDKQLEPGLEHIPSHTAAHIAKARETNLHDIPLLKNPLSARLTGIPANPLYTSFHVAGDQ